MHYLVAALLIVILPAWGAAQTKPPKEPEPSIGLPLPPIGLPLPVLGLEQVTEPAREASRPPRGDRAPFWPRYPIVFFGAPYAWGIDDSERSPVPGTVAAPAQEPPRPTTGYLRLNVEPASLLQIYLDGQYAGTPWDYDNSEISLTPGSWRVELRAPGYDTVSFDARITAGHTITYHGALAPSEIAQEPPSAAKPPADSTFYLIPGCYMGNVPPEQVKLPPGCDRSRVIIHKPVR